MERTDSFKWEDLPTGNTDSEQFSSSGWIPRINVFSISVGILTFCCTAVLTTIRIEKKYENKFNA